MGQSVVSVPGAIFLISMWGTLWFTAGFSHSPFCWFPFIQAGGNQSPELIKAFLAVGIFSLGMWYICNSIATFSVLCTKRRIWHYDYTLLVTTFGIIPNNPDQTERENAIGEELLTLQQPPKMRKMHINKKKHVLKKALQDALLAELLTRVHSHGPQPLIDHFIRMNTLWYMALNSKIASILGWGIAFVVIVINCFFHPVTLLGLFGIPGLILAFIIFFCFLPVLFYMIALRWSKEGWDVYCKWIAWDIITHPAPADWWRNDIKLNP